MFRLANAHCVSLGKLTGYLLAPQLSEKYSKNPFRFPPPHINGYGNLSRQTLDVLEKLNGLSCNTPVTLKNFETVFSLRNLLRQHRAWCPLCLEDMIGKIIYEKLIWYITKYDVCITHQVKIESICSKCELQQESIPQKGQNGYCQYCNNWLGRENNKTSNINEIEDKEIIYKSMQIEEMINYFFKKPAEKRKLISSLKKIDSQSKSEMQRRELCFYNLGIVNETFINYLKGSGRLSLDILLEISWNLKVSIVKLMEDQPIDISIDNESFISRRRPYKHETDYLIVKQYLEDIIRGNKFTHLSRIEANINISGGTLRKRFPELMSKIINKNNSLRKKYGKKIEQGYKSDLTEIRNYLNEVLHSYKITPINHIASQLGVSHTFLTKKYPNLTDSIYQKNQALMEERVIKESDEVSKYHRIENEELKKIQVKLLDILESIIDEPKFINDILNEIGKSRAFVKYFPDIFNKIVEKNKEVVARNREQLFKQRKELIKESVIYLHSNGIYPGIKTVERHVGFKLDKNLHEIRGIALAELNIEKKMFPK